jgi:hypothetical protein
MSDSHRIERYLPFSRTVGVLERILPSYLLIEHLSLLRRRRWRPVLPLTKVIVIDIRRRPIRRMIVVGSGSHVWRRSARRRPVELALALRRLLRRRVVVLVVHMVLLTRIRHDAADKQTRTAISILKTGKGQRLETRR